MKLDDRKLKILQAVIHSYITCAEPIGSRTLSKNYNLGVSSATIRNEMSDLEELGFLLQPYTSAGRIPSDKAYRLYVDYLMQTKTVDEWQRERIKEVLLTEIDEIDAMIQNAARMLSKLTSYTSLVIAPQLKESRLKHIQLVPINENKILAVLVTDSGIVKNAVFRTENRITSEQLNQISNLLTQKLKNIKFADIGLDIEQALIREIFSLRDTIRDSLKTILPIVNQSSEAKDEIDLYAEGVTNIFNFPEYNDITKAKTFLAFLEDKQAVVDMLLDSGLHDIEITIGNENKYQPVKSCSLITATYKLNGKTIGKIGVIGPTRMDYSKVISIVKSMSLDLNDILKDNFI